MDRKQIILREHWKFYLEEQQDIQDGAAEGYPRREEWEAWYKGFDDSGWQDVAIPHDWSVELPFSREYSSGTGYLAGGIGWYRLHFFLPESCRGKSVKVVFDGVYKNSQVWCNSYYLGRRPYGYSTFSYDITYAAAFGDTENVLCVRVDHRDIADSRWFTGSGITRKVTLVLQEPVHPAEYGVFFRAEQVEPDGVELLYGADGASAAAKHMPEYGVEERLSGSGAAKAAVRHGTKQAGQAEAKYGAEERPSGSGVSKAAVKHGIEQAGEAEAEYGAEERPSGSGVSKAVVKHGIEQAGEAEAEYGAAESLSGSGAAKAAVKHGTEQAGEAEPCAAGPIPGTGRARIIIRHRTEKTEGLPCVADRVHIRSSLVDGEGNAVLTLEGEAGVCGECTLFGTLEGARLWSPEQPYLYKLRTWYSLPALSGEEGTEYLADETAVGIREILFDSEKGFFLNGIETKLKGVCVHHDGGALGAAMEPEVWQRRLSVLKECGCNAIRCSHNPHMPELYDLCDRMGFLMMDEAFDEWENAKNKWSNGHNVYPPVHQGYFEEFPQWHDVDLRAMVRRDRNHPSVILWSIGNEIDYPNDPYCHPSFASMTGNNDADKPAAERQYDPCKPNALRLVTIAEKLERIVREEDMSRPVTLAAAFPELSAETGLFRGLDVVGYNYKEHLYDKDHERFPDKPILGSENGHGYGAWLAVRENAYISGQFLWTGIDYLGETKLWPCHGSAAGLLTCAGEKKPEFYRRKSFWCREPMVAISTRSLEEGAEGWRPMESHWNYREGERVLVKVYSNLPEVRLMLNGEKIGRLNGYNGDGEYWFQVDYRPGVLTAQGFAAVAADEGEAAAEAVSAEDSGKEGAVPAECIGKEGAMPAECIGKEGAMPAEDSGKEGAVPAEDSGKEGAVPAEDSGKEGAVPAECIGKEGAMPAEDSGKEGAVPAECIGREGAVPAEDCGKVRMPAAVCRLATTGPAEKISCRVWQQPDALTGKSWKEASEEPGYLYQLELGLEDAQGSPVAWQEWPMSVEVEGAGELAGLENGNLTDTTPYSSRSRSTCRGRLLAFVRRRGRGEISVRVSARDCHAAVRLG